MSWKEWVEPTYCYTGVFANPTLLNVFALSRPTSQIPAADINNKKKKYLPRLV